MTHKPTRNYSLSVVAAFIAILILLIAAAVLAQVTGAGRPSGQANVVLAPPGAAASAQAVRPLIPWTDDAGRFPVSRSHTKRHGASPMDENPPLFLPAATYGEGGTNAIAIAVADVNGDGTPDLVVANECGDPSCTSSSVGVLLGNGDGTFQPVMTYGAAGSYALGLAVADLDGDGKPDVVVANYLSSSVTVLLGNGDGTFRLGATYDSGGIWAKAVTIADVNGDGKPDLVVGNASGPNVNNNSVSVLLGNGDGTFQTAIANDSGGTSVSSLSVADVNGDGRPDLVVVNGCARGNCANGADVVVLMGNGDGTFQSPVSHGSGANDPGSVAVGDVNGDGKPDLLVANGSSVGVLLGNGDGTFQPAVTWPSGGGQSIKVADVNGDAKPDLLMVGGRTVFVMLGYGDGGFEAPLTFDSGSVYSSSIAVADLNRDGRPDLAVSHQTYLLGVLLNNTSGTPIPTTTTLTSSLNPSVFGQAVTFTAALSAASGTPAGTVIFYDSSTAIGSATLASGSASISISSPSAGSHSITAGYQGGGGFGNSRSAPLNQVVTPAATTTSLASSQNPAVVTETVTYNATVASQYGGAGTGTVVFRDGGSTVATVPIAGNQAAYSTKYSTPGTHSITATYSGDANNTGSVSSPLVEQINKGFPSNTVLTTSGSPSIVGQPVTFTAKVTSKYGTIPNGELVTFYDGATTIATVATASGVATFVTSSLTAKTHTIKGTYSGDAIFKPSTWKVTQVVNGYPTTTTLSSSLNPSNYGQAVTFTATVTSSGPYPLTGKVMFWDGTLGIGTAKLSGEVATLTKRWLAPGTHPITAQYLGDSANAISTSAVLNQVVQ